MIDIACQCGGLPAHDHRIPNRPFEQMTEAERDQYRNGDKFYEPYHFDMIDVGRVWVDWKKVAKALMTEDEA